MTEKSPAVFTYLIHRHTHYFMVLPAIIILLSIVIYPMIYSFWTSLHTWYLGKPQQFPFVGFDNYYTILLKDPVFRISLRNTLLLLAVCIPAELVLGLILALLLNREDLKGRKIFRSILIAPVVLTPVVAGVLWKFIFHPRLGILNYFLSLIGIEGVEWVADPSFALISVMIVDIWQWTAFMMLVLYAGIISLPQEPYEAAQLDGATSWQLLIYITMPLLRPIVIVALLIRTMDIVKMFDVIYVLTRGGPGNATEVLTLYNFRVGLNYFDMGKAAAISWVIAVIIILLAQAYLRMTRTELYKRGPI